MNATLGRIARALVHFGAVSVVAAWLTGCANPWQTNASVAAGTSVLGLAPTTNILQTYYLGAFDPQGQLPPTIYRVRVQGQSSALSSTKFASGWVRADLIDSLSGRVDMESVSPPIGPTDGAASLTQDQRSPDRRLVMFGPEGFREAPKNHRLVIVMGSSPATYFEAMDRALGVIAGVTQPTHSGQDLLHLLWPEIARMRQERLDLNAMIDLANKE
jgi:hypothetical protein